MLLSTLMAVSVLGLGSGPAAPLTAIGHVRRTDVATSVTDADVRAYIRDHSAASGAGNAMALFAMEHAIPAFARRLNVACSYCHTTIPRLNEAGYKFRAAGFREPDKIGTLDPAKFELGDFFSARIQSRFDVQVTNQPNGAAVANLVSGQPGDRTTTIAPSFMEATLYPLSGSWGKNFGSFVELSVSPEDFFEVENAYLRVVSGTEKSFFTSRIGVFHPWEGIGASDRPFSNGRTLFQTVVQSSGGRGVPYVYQPWGLDEVGFEIGGEFDKLSVRGAILGGTFMRWEGGANTFIAFPSQTGPWKGANQAVPDLGKPFDYLSHNTPDFSANVTYTLSAKGGGVSLLYYHGNIATPTACTDGTLIGKVSAGGEQCGVAGSSAGAPFGAAGNTDFAFDSAGGAFRNNFDRVGVYASYPIGKQFIPSAGYQYGKDTSPDGTTFTSNGLFVEGALVLSRYATIGARYDQFRPNTTVNSRQWAFTPFVNIPLQNGLQIIAEYQHRDFELAPGTYHRKNDTFQMRMIIIQ